MLLICSRRRNNWGGMVQISDIERRRAFLVWLRTGRWPTVPPSGDVEVKFNPWHDPADGRVTFAGSGRAYGWSDGNGSLVEVGRQRRQSYATIGRGIAISISEDSHKLRAAPAPNPQNIIPRSVAASPRPAKPNPNAEKGWTGRGFTGGGGGRFGSGGAS